MENRIQIQIPMDNKSTFSLILMLIFTLNIDGLNGQNRKLAFPSAEGFGKYTSGGREGKVWIIKNLNDSGAGSLREAVNAKGPRTIIFAVSGNIKLKSTLEIKHGDLTIAGQSAPGDGICIQDFPVVIKSDNVIVRYLRFRLGDETEIEDDAFKGNKIDHIMIDHCSISWATDECASFYDNTYFTMQWCIISESLNNSLHHKGNHGYGGIWGGMKASFHHNLLAHHTSRNPRLQGARYHKKPEAELADFRNNVIYNWQSNSAYAGEEGNYNLVNNYYKSGPATKEKVKYRILNPYEPFGNFYVAKNVVEGNSEVSNDNWKGVEGEYPERIKRKIPFEVEKVNTQSPEKAFEFVLAKAGCSLKRDVVDLRIIEEVKKGTATYGNGIIDSQREVGGWPLLNSTVAPADTDQDGMPDEWEKTNGLDPKKASDAILYSLDKQYTNLEKYLNDLVSQENLAIKN